MVQEGFGGMQNQDTGRADYYREGEILEKNWKRLIKMKPLHFNKELVIEFIMKKERRGDRTPALECITQVLDNQGGGSLADFLI